MWERLSAPRRQADIRCGNASRRQADVRCEKTSAPPLSVRQLPSVCRTGKGIPIYRRYARNSGQSDSDLLADHTHAEIVIVPAMGTDLLGRQYDAVVQPAGRSPEQPPCCGDVSFGHPPPPNCEGLARPIDEVVRSNWVVMRSDEAV